MAGALSSARPIPYERREDTPAKREPYTRDGGSKIVALITGHISDGPTCGYLRVGALMNREPACQDRSPVNRKLIYRIGKLHGL